MLIAVAAFLNWDDCGCWYLVARLLSPVAYVWQIVLESDIVETQMVLHSAGSQDCGFAENNLMMFLIARKVDIEKQSADFTSVVRAGW